jgi:NAD(P)H dehydrogenase (quinone)
MSYVVTGATGHLGRLIVEALLDRGAAPEQITATGRRLEALAPFAERGVKTARLDYTDPASIDAALEPGDTLILVSGSEVGQRIAQHTAVIDAAKRVGVARIIYTSAPHADDTALILAPEHTATEQAIRESGLPFTLLRNGWYTENYVQTVSDAAESGVITASVGDGRVASASRVDYAEAAAAAALDEASTGQVFELTGDTAWGFGELATTASHLLGRPVRYEPLSPAAHADVLRSAGLDDGTVGFVVGLDENIRNGLLAHTPGDLRKLIGRPTTPLADGLAAALPARDLTS